MKILILVFTLFLYNVCVFADVVSYYGIDIEGTQYQILDTEIILSKMSTIPIKCPNGETWDLLYLFKRMGVNKIDFNNWDPNGYCEAYVDKGSRIIHVHPTDFIRKCDIYLGYKKIIPLLFHEATHIFNNINNKNMNYDDNELNARNVERDIENIVNNY